MTDLPFAETVNFWKTSRTSPDTWLEKAHRQVERLGGVVTHEGYGHEPQLGRAAYMLAFRFGEQAFRIIWPVLPTRGGDERATHIQAATALYHAVKNRSLEAAIFGPRVAFFRFMVLPDGRTADQAAVPDLLDALPKMLRAPTVDGEYREIT